MNYQKFAEICSDELWLGRKLVALPAAAFCATLKTIYHLAEAILIGCLKALSDDGKYCQAKFFSIGRDFQEAFGRLVTLLNDKKGNSISRKVDSTRLVISVLCQAGKYCRKKYTCSFLKAELNLHLSKQGGAISVID
ncbi:MAG: hypothetical protein HWD61_06370 [Parachlamydiaceae bacterium]|nr:MAG: hypothetical protein HWD61_06370 [Parachlamydiaceae bacterium]